MPNLWFSLCLRELKRILGDRRIVVLLLGGPFFYAVLFGGVYWNGRTKQVPIVIVDQDHSHLSRDLTTALNASENVKIVGWVNSTDDLLPLVRREIAYACIFFPPQFERDMLAGKQPRIGVVSDASNVLIAGSVANGVRSVLATYQVGIDRIGLETSGMPVEAAGISAMPLQPAIRLLFNPTSNYSFFILMGLVCIAIQSVTRMGCGVALELDSADQLSRAFPGIRLSNAMVFASKVAATAALALPVAYCAIALPFILFGAPYRGNVFVLLVALTVFVVSQIFIAYIYAYLCKSAVLCTQIHMFMSVVMFTLSGFTWPYYAAPVAIQRIAFLTPLFHMNCLIRKSALVGAPASSLYPHLTMLVVLCILTGIWGYTAVCNKMKTDAQGRA